MQKSVLLVLAGVVIGALATSIIILHYQLPTRISKIVSGKAEPSPMPSPNPSPSPTPNPSEKSLRVAAFAWARANDTQMKELKLMYNAQDKTDAQFLSIWALSMDNDSALYAKNEAIMEKTLSIENRSMGSTQQNAGTQTPSVDLYIK